MDLATQDRLVGSVYNAATGRTSWDPALDALAHSLAAFAIHMIGVDKRTGGVMFSHYGGPARPESHLDYVRRYHQIDERIAFVVANTTTSWTHCPSSLTAHPSWYAANCAR